MASPAHVRGDHSRSFPILLLLSAAIVGELWLGGSALMHCIAGQLRPNYFATAGLLLSLAAVGQFRVACCIFLHRARADVLPPRKVLRGLFVSGCVSYGIALAVGPVLGIGLLWTGCFALLGSITLLPLTANPQTVERWRKLVQQTVPRRVGLTVYHTMLAVTIAESVLRGYRALDTAAPCKIAAADQPVANAEPSATAPAARPGVLRVAVIDGLAGAAESETFCPDELASSPGLDVFRLSRAAGGAPRNQWREPLEAQRPDLVLAMVRLEHGLKPVASAGDAFDWRSLETARLLSALFATRLIAAPSDLNSELPLPRGASGPLADCDGRRLAICRTPLDDAAKAQWRATFAELDGLLADCAESHVRVALVVVPDGFQVNRVLCDTLRRRAGYEPREFDLALPQRRLATYAQERRLDLVDLLPYLQASREPVYQHAAGGWNEQGKAVASRAICGWLESQYSGLTATAQLSRGH